MRNPSLSSDRKIMSKKRKLLIFILLFLCGCSRQRQIACSRFYKDDSLILEIEAVNDDIVSMRTVELFVLPEDLLADEKRFSDLEKQFDESCHMEGNRLIRTYELPLERKYSLALTLEELKKEKSYCE